jgi:hypothetical protein
MKYTDCKVSLFVNDLTVVIAKHPNIFSSLSYYQLEGQEIECFTLSLFCYHTLYLDY